MLKAVSLLVAVYCAVIGGAMGARAQSPVLDIVGPVVSDTVFDGHVAYLRDPRGDLDLDAALGTAADSFRTVTSRSADFGYTRDAIWLRIAVRNASADTRDWRLHLRENFLPEFDVWRVDDGGGVTLLESHDPATTFEARKVRYPELVVPFHLAPGAAATLYMRYTSGGSSEVSFSVESAETFDRLAARKTAKNYIYYGMMILLIVAAAIAWIATQRSIFGAYGAYAICGLLFVMHADGTAFQYLWPGLPVFNAYVSVLLGAGLIVFGSNFARMFLQTRTHHPVLDKLLLGAMLVTLALVLATSFADTQPIKKVLVLLAMISILLFTVSGLVAARTRFREVRFYVIAWSGALVSSGIMTARHWLGIEISEEMQFDSMRIVLVADATLMGLAIIDRFNQFKRRHQDALEASLLEARRNLDLNRRLSDLEQKYGLVLATAESSRRQIAETVHDIRQPLRALRLNVEHLLRSDRGGDRGGTPAPADFETAFGYLEDLVGKELARIGKPGTQAGPENDGPPAGTGAYPVGEVLSSVQDMFLKAAREKGLDLRCVAGTAQTDLPPLVLMRIASNLVSNAIKYTSRGRILIGVRRRAGHLRLEVHDTGPGMNAAEFTKARARSARLPRTATAEGTGLGLSIVSDLADRHDLAVSLCARRKDGTGITVTLPCAEVPAAAPDRATAGMGRAIL